MPVHPWTFSARTFVDFWRLHSKSRTINRLVLCCVISAQPRLFQRKIQVEALASMFSNQANYKRTFYVETQVFFVYKIARSRFEAGNLPHTTYTNWRELGNRCRGPRLLLAWKVFCSPLSLVLGRLPCIGRPEPWRLLAQDCALRAIPSSEGLKNN